LFIDEEKKTRKLIKYEGIADTALAVAVGCNRISVVKHLLQKGANPNLKANEFSSYPIHFIPANLASSEDKIALTSLLLEYDADINIQQKWIKIRDKEGYHIVGEEVTVLFRFCNNTDLKVIEYFLKNDANPNITSIGKCSQGDSIVFPLRTAIQINNFNLAKLLLKYEADPNIDFDYNIYEKGKMFELEASSLVEFIIYNGKNIQFLKLLLEHNANPNHIYFGTGSGRRNTLTTLRAAIGNLEYFTELLNNQYDKANPNFSLGENFLGYILGLSDSCVNSKDKAIHLNKLLEAGVYASQKEREKLLEKIDKSSLEDKFGIKRKFLAYGVIKELKSEESLQEQSIFLEISSFKTQCQEAWKFVNQAITVLQGYVNRQGELSIFPAVITENIIEQSRPDIIAPQLIPHLKNVLLSIYRQLKHKGERNEQDTQHEFDRIRDVKPTTDQVNASNELICSQGRAQVKNIVNCFEQQSFVVRLVTERLALTQEIQEKVQ
jgi:ankyrin repeat protein